MDGSHPILKPASELARHDRRYPNESPEYRVARTALLAEEIEVRRHLERVAEQRRALPPGGAIPRDYEFVGEDGPVKFSALFGEHDTLLVYNWMFGPQRERPCPMCTSLLSAWEGEVPDITQRISLAVVATAPIGKLLAFKRERGWKHLPIYSSGGTSFNLDYGFETPQTGDIPAINVFTRKDGTIRHFWGGEMGGESADPGQDPRGAPDPMPLWNILDWTPEGRGTDWYPSLNY